MSIRPILSALLRNKTAPLLIALQVALTLAIVANALYIIRDRLATAARPSGVDEAVLFETRFYPHRPIADIGAMQRQDLAAILAVPGVVSAAWSNQLPMTRSGWNTTVRDADAAADNRGQNAAQYFSPDPLLQTLGLRLLEGRDFVASDVIESNPQTDRNQPQAVIVTQALARALWPDADTAVGKRLLVGGDGTPPMTVVGVVERLQTPWAQAEGAESSVILPMRYLDPYTRYVVRAEPGRLAEVQAAVEAALVALRNDRVLLGSRSLAEIRDRRYASERLMAGLLTAVTVFLLLITASGIVGMASLWVNQRRKQIGVRRAIGARRVDILLHFLTENVLITSAGIALGVLLALALNNALTSTLSIPRLPPGYIAATMLAMWVLGLLAVFGPAWRAASVPPAVATRSA